MTYTPDLQAKSEIPIFPHETWAIEQISQELIAQNIGHLLHNLFLFDKLSNQYLEVDVVIITQSGIYVIELKHWTGQIQILANTWILNRAFNRKDPHILNNTKAKILRGILERYAPQVKLPFVESVVVLTNPEAIVDTASDPATHKSNPTFDKITSLIRYLKNQRQVKGALLTELQCSSFINYLKSINSPGRPRDIQFPGYEIVEKLYQGSDRVEVIARRTDLKYRMLSRLRIFYPPLGMEEEVKNRFRERATATLNAVAKAGDHPNILKVWAVPNEYGYVVEGSDWSEKGTLQDLLSHHQGLLSLAYQESIVQGVLSALEVLHHNGVIHRALSPENIIMFDKTPKLTNFDFSYQLEDDRITVIPDATVLKRSPYIAPEVYRLSKSLSESADLFSVGVILFELYTGVKPFACSTDLQHSKGQLSESAAAQLKKIESITLRKLIIDLLSMDPSKRPQCTKEVLKEFGQEKQEAIIKEINRELHEGEKDDLYSILNLMQKGVESQLYRAHGAQGRLVVLKIFDIAVPLQRIVNEYELGGAVRHPSIVRLDSYGRWSDGRFFIAFDWIAGQSLREKISFGRPELSTFLRVASQLLAAISELHDFTLDEVAMPILHNDIKPENVLLTEESRPILIDFGIASYPCIGLYSGTEGYVDPVLRKGTDRQYCIAGDLYSVAVTIFEWLFGRLPELNDFDEDIEDLWTGLPSGLQGWFERAIFHTTGMQFANASEMLIELQHAMMPPGEIIKSEETNGDEASKSEIVQIAEFSKVQLIEPRSVVSTSDECLELNPFVAYVNSLHGRDASSENALAESQAINPSFGWIQVAHPLAELIYGQLTAPERNHVILTGHAGDGKSTIALEVFKRLSRLATDQPLTRELNRREDVLFQGYNVSLVKDLSEWPAEKKQDLLIDLLGSTNDERFFIVSNTGTLLDAFRIFEEKNDGNVLELEDKLLDAISSAEPKLLSFHNSSFCPKLQLQVEHFGKMAATSGCIKVVEKCIE